MSSIGRIFSVLNLILAALFLSWASMALSDADSFRVDLDQERLDRATEKAGLETELAAARAGKDEAVSRENRVANERDGLQADNDRLSGDVTDKDRQNTEMNANLGRISNSLDQAIASGNAADEAKSAAVERANASDNAKTEALSARETAETQVADLQAEIARLEKVVMDRDMALVSMGKDLDQRNTELGVLIDATGVNAGDILAMPLINGVVIEALYDIEPGLVAINKGTADKVERGYTFDIYNGADYKGRVRVENVRENSCTAIVTQPIDGKRIGQGDKAATRL